MASWSRTGCLVATLNLALACSAETPPERPVAYRLGNAAARLSRCLSLPSTHVAGFFGSPQIGGASEETRRCLEQADDCSRVLSCLGYSAEPCEPGCEGDVARNCFELPNGLGVAAREDCAQNAHGNGVCSLVVDESKGNYAFCHLGQTCTESRCEGGVGYFCDAGQEVAFPCEAGETCVSDGTSTACVRDLPCERDHCDESGETLYVCAGGRVAIEARCEEVLPGTHCEETAAVANCVARVSDPSCQRDPFASFCEGDLAVACGVGVRYELDCATEAAACVARDGAAWCQ